MSDKIATSLSCILYDTLTSPIKWHTCEVVAIVIEGVSAGPSTRASAAMECVEFHDTRRVCHWGQGESLVPLDARGNVSLRGDATGGALHRSAFQLSARSNPESTGRHHT